MFGIITLFIIITVYLIYVVYQIYSITRKYNLKRKKQEQYRNISQGKIYETTILLIIKKFFSKNCIFQNIYLESVYGGVTEIDVLAIHNTGIYVIECKNLHGSIKGNAQDKMWLYTKKDGEQYELLNPVIQNNIHLNACKKLLDRFGMPYYSIIVFNNKCNMPNISYKAKNAYIIYQKEMVSLIKYLTSQKHIYTNKVIYKIREIILSEHEKYKINQEYITIQEKI